jgi:hypothetical protein
MDDFSAVYQFESGQELGGSALETDLHLHHPLRLRAHSQDNFDRFIKRKIQLVSRVTKWK